MHRFFTNNNISLFPDDLNTGTNDSNNTDSSSHTPNNLPSVNPRSFISTIQVSSDPPLRHSSRVIQPIVTLRDYHCYSAIVSLYEPRTYHEASTNHLW